MYCGWSVFVVLCGKNIRYLLELIDNSLILHERDGNEMSAPVTFKNQTLAAQNVGKKNLSELEGLSKFGAYLTKLVLGIGRIFGVMAIDSAGHAPEVNQFKIVGRFADIKQNEIGEFSVADVINAAVMHLAIQAFRATKRKDVGDTRDMSYQLHPIFSPYFVYSYKKGRDFVLGESDIIGIISTPKSTIRSILSRNNRSDQEFMPEQLTLFGGYYDGQR